MKKRTILAVLAITAMSVTLFAGCSRDAVPQPTNTTPASTTVDAVSSADNGSSQGITTNQVKYETVNAEALLKDNAALQLNEYQKDKCYRSFTIGEDHYIQVFAGEKTSGGHDIAVKSVEDVEGTLKVVVKETAPAKDSTVTMMIMYPSVMFKVDSQLDKITVVNTDGDEYPQMKTPTNDITQ